MSNEWKAFWVIMFAIISFCVIFTIIIVSLVKHIISLRLTNFSTVKKISLGVVQPLFILLVYKNVFGVRFLALVGLVLTFWNYFYVKSNRVPEKIEEYKKKKAHFIEELKILNINLAQHEQPVRNNYVDTSFWDQMAEERREQFNQERQETYQQEVRDWYNGL